MPSPNISFAKIVATPSRHTWSQAYNAGSLFLAISLSSSNEETSLIEEGKRILGSIEAEFFALEKKTLDTIEAVVDQSLSQIPESIKISLAFSYVKDDILYCFVRGGGVVVLKRGSKRAPLITGVDTDSLTSASGHLKTDDLILLQTKQFASLIPEKTLQEAFDYPLPNDIAETISPHVHTGQESGASAIILAFKGIPKPFDKDTLSIDETLEPPPHKEPELTHQPDHVDSQSKKDEDEPEYAISETSSSHVFLESIRSRLPTLHLSKQKKLMVGVLSLLIVLLIVGIVVTKQAQSSKEDELLFNKIYPAALKEYEEGEKFIKLNPDFAREDFLAARDTLKETEGKFSPDSEYGQKIATLNEKIKKRLEETDISNKLTATNAKEGDAPLLAEQLKKRGTLAGVESEDNLYLLTPDEVVAINKTTNKAEALIENDNDWTKAVSVAVFGTNLYILDQKNGLLKFVPTEDDYVMSKYFTVDGPDLTNAVSLAIDGSVYILFKDGTIKKYTRGNEEPFTLTGLKNPLKNPSFILTSPEMDSIYILDQGTGVVLRAGKDGKVENIYQADVFKETSAISLSPDAKILYALHGKSISKLTLK